MRNRLAMGIGLVALALASPAEGQYQTRCETRCEETSTLHAESRPCADVFDGLLNLNPLVNQQGTLCSMLSLLGENDEASTTWQYKNANPSVHKAVDAWRHYLLEHSGVLGVIDMAYDSPYCQDKILSGGIVTYLLTTQGKPSLYVILSYDRRPLRQGFIPLSLLEQYASSPHGEREHELITQKLAQILPQRCPALAPDAEVPTIDLRNSKP